MERTADGAREELHRSLRHLHTDHLDLYQLHALSKPEEVDTIFAPGGAMEAFLEAREAGLVRYLGFSAHSEAAALDAMSRFTFDTALFPVNFITYYAGGFGPRLLARAQEQGVACLALKSMARTRWPEGAPWAFPHCWYEPISDPALADLSLRFTLSEPITAAIPPGDPALFRMALDLADSFHPLTPQERAELQQYARGVSPIFQSA